MSKKQFRPYLNYKVINNFNFGYIGEKTDLTALGGEPLYVGDVVEVYDCGRKTNLGESFIVCVGGQYFVMGLRGAKFTNGISNICKFQIRKVKSYKDLQDGEKYDYIEAITKERK